GVVVGAGGGVGRVLGRAVSLLWSFVRRLGRLPSQMKATLLAIARLRPNARFWSVVLGLLVVPFGAFLMVAPANELAASTELDLRSLLPATWLLAGLATLTAGLGMVFRAPSVPRPLSLALLVSLPPPARAGPRA